MKKYFKKILSLLLIATSFNFLLILDKAPNNILTYAETEVNQKTDVINVSIGTWKYVHVKGTPFYIRSNVYEENPKLYSKDSLNKIFQSAKDKIYENLGLNYTDEIKTEIFVEKEISDCTEAGFFYSFGNSIAIRKDCFSNATLSHEMTHALLCHILGKNYEKLNRGLNEGFACQSMKDLGFLLKFWFKLGFPNDECFADRYPSNALESLKFYLLHQRIVRDWIETEGKDVIKTFIEKVKNGEDSVKVFLELGGDKIVKKYNCTTVPRSKFAKILNKALLRVYLSPFLFIYGLSIVFKKLTTLSSVVNFFVYRKPRVRRVDQRQLKRCNRNKKTPLM